MASRNSKRMANPALLLSGLLLTLAMQTGARAEPPVAISPETAIAETKHIVGPPMQSAGGGYWLAGAQDTLSEMQRKEIFETIERNVRALGLDTRRADKSKAGVLFSWPMRQANGWADYGFHVISNYVDHDPGFPNHIQDYQCGTRSYDLASGYNHKGTDIASWPFAWLKMQNDAAQVVAAAAGTIVNKSDGHPDHSCAMSSADWNAVYIRHEDGSTAWYGHLKSGSLTAKSIGEHVEAGEFLGVTGSSGSSTGPHLHLEVYDADNHLIDPWLGACNTSTTRSWWAAQRPYYDPSVLMLATGGAPPNFPACPGVETPNFKTVFRPGETVYYLSYYRDQPNGATARFRLYAPDGSIYSEWEKTFAQYYTASYWYWYGPLDASVPAGSWIFEAELNGTAYRSYFEVASDPANIPVATATEYFNANLGHYFLTADPAEMHFVDTGGAGPGWLPTGFSFGVYPNQAVSYLNAEAPVCRFYGPGPNSHFYTANAAECAYLRANDPGWVYEGIAYKVIPAWGGACTPGTAPVYRAYNGRWQQNDSNHRFSTRWAEYQRMIAAGWNAEGVVMCARQ